MTELLLEDEKGNRKEILSFGPLCVAPEYQRQKLGKILIEHSFEVAKKLGYEVNINFGNPGNYVSRGFVSCKKKNVSFVLDAESGRILYLQSFFSGKIINSANFNLLGIKNKYLRSHMWPLFVR